ncbi:MAG: hypothetical protein FWJ85_11490 [Solitalea sp.]
MTESLHSLYKSRRDEYASAEDDSRKKARLYASFRLITAAIIAGSLWQAVANPHWWWISLASGGTLLFVLLVRGHGKYRWKQRYFRRLRRINEQEIAALNGQWNQFPSGEVYQDATHPYALDLDIFGKNSVFQLVNRTATRSGEALLARTLTTPPADPGLIQERQRAIAELASRIDFRQHFLAKGLEGVKETSGETRQLLHWLEGPAIPFNTLLMRLARILLPAGALFLLMLALVGLVPHSAWVLAVLLNLGITGLFLKPINRIHAVLSQKHMLLEKFSLLLWDIEQEEFENETLRALRRKGTEASRAIGRLTGILGFFDQRLNFMVGAALNGFLLSDLQCVAALDRWRFRYRDQMPGWLDSIFRFEELNSFATYAYNHPGFCYPEFREKPLVASEQMGHPLMAGPHCVPNDFLPRTEEKVVILTGANMSGKSTFLRCLGVNLVLAYAGAPVYARKFSCSPAAIWSSMRVTDSLSDNTSYFHAELKRLSRIMERLRAGQKLVILLDEILKGTNSTDKLHGSTGLVAEFLRHDCLCIIATHDLELGKLEEKHPVEVSNYCFESTLEENELRFDYRLRKGIARNKNATFLMRRTGLIK